MQTNLFRHCVVALFLGLTVSSVRALDLPFASDDPWFHETDPLAPRDHWGVFHQGPHVTSVDFAHRHWGRACYYLKSGRELLTDPAYVGALQVSLRNRGYYCGPIDGVMSGNVSEAIARCQKNHAQRVTGTLTVPVRRVLYLP